MHLTAVLVQETSGHPANNLTLMNNTYINNFNTNTVVSILSIHYQYEMMTAPTPYSTLRTVLDTAWDFWVSGHHAALSVSN